MFIKPISLSKVLNRDITRVLAATRCVSLKTNNEEINQQQTLDSSASTLIIGGGIVGTSVAYHLAKKGEQGVTLLEKSELTAGSTWHAAGLTTNYHASVNMKKIHYASLNFYSKITAETGQEIGFHRPGSIRVAQKQTHIDEFRYQMAKAGIQDAPMQIITPEQIKEKVPFIREDKILVGLYTPYDGHVDPYSLTQAIAIGARKYGVSIHQHTEVTALILREDGRWSVSTSKGDVIADRVVNATGFWAKEVGKMAGLNLPLVAIQHQYLVTSTVPEIQELKQEFPVLRLMEASCYVRQERDGFLVGPYERVDLMKLKDDWAKDGVPKGFGKELFPSDIDRLMPHLEQVMDLLPPFASANIQTVVNGPITYSPDVLPLLGPTTLPNMWLASGVSYGIIHGGGIGKFLAEWIQNGEPSHDLIECDTGRFGSWASENYALAKCREVYGMNNAPTYPHEERFAGRPTTRITTAYDKQKERGANMVFDAGWEHPAWFAAPGQKAEYKPSFGRTNWHSAVQREWELVTSTAGVIDLSPFGKIILDGPQSCQFLDHVTANSIPAVGRCVLTHLLTPSGKVYAELTISRLEENKFLIITGGSTEVHDLRWMLDIARKCDWKVSLNNISDDFGCLSVAGPKSKEILSNLHPNFKEPFPFFSSQKLQINGIDTITVRLSYTGELGWEIYHPISETGKLYENIMGAGEKLGLSDLGSLTLNVLRLEKGFRMWGKEMNHDNDIVEAGLLPFVNMNKKDFIGKKAVERILKENKKRELVMIKIDPKSEFDPQGDETIWVGKKGVGNTTSGCFSCLLNQPIAFAYLPPFLSTPGTIVQVEIMTNRYDAEVLSRPPALTYNEKLSSKRK